MSHAQDATETFGSDSFLDVVANTVGIMIILVIIVGLRIKHAPHKAPDADVPHELVSQVKGLAGDVAGVSALIAELEQETIAQRRQRDMAALALAAARSFLDEHRRKLDERQRREIDLRAQLATDEQRLDELQEQLSQPSDQGPRIEVVSYPTPLARTVFGREEHFQLRGGRIVYIPLEPLLSRVRVDFERNLYKLRQQSDLVDGVGPIDGFRLRYAVERVDPSVSSQLNGSGGSYAQLAEWELLPVSDDLGEPTAKALQADSVFRADLAGMRPQEVSITIWVYPDSFPDFRQFKAFLHEQGYATAGRPLPADQKIGGSPAGSRPSAQ